MRGEWIEIGLAPVEDVKPASPLMRGEWIEITLASKTMDQPLRLPSCEGSGLK